MQLYAGVTDYDWFQYLAAAAPDEVNFWRPGGSQGFRALDPGEPFLFKLKAPHNAIAGGGFFIRYTTLPLTVAWSTFGVKNGTPDFETFAAKIRQYRSDDAPNPAIGCVILTRPFFFAPEDWVPVPENWHPNIVQGKTYDMQRGAGARLWQQVQDRLQARPPNRIGPARRPSSQKNWPATAPTTLRNTASVRAASARSSPTRTTAAAPLPAKRRCPRCRPRTSSRTRSPARTA